jgi:hypothetical protein
MVPSRANSLHDMCHGIFTGQQSARYEHWCLYGALSPLRLGYSQQSARYVLIQSALVVLFIHLVVR